MAKALRSPEHRALVAILVGPRKAKKIKQEEIAEIIGWSQSEVSRVEQGERIPDILTFIKWAKAIKEDPGRLFERLLKY